MTPTVPVIGPPRILDLNFSDARRNAATHQLGLVEKALERAAREES